MLAWQSRPQQRQTGYTVLIRPHHHSNTQISHKPTPKNYEITQTSNCTRSALSPWCVLGIGCAVIVYGGRVLSELVAIAPSATGWICFRVSGTAGKRNGTKPAQRKSCITNLSFVFNYCVLIARAFNGSAMASRRAVANITRARSCRLHRYINPSESQFVSDRVNYAVHFWAFETCTSARQTTPNMASDSKTSATFQYFTRSADET